MCIRDSIFEGLICVHALAVPGKGSGRNEDFFFFQLAGDLIRTVAVTGSSPKGSVHIYNLDGVRFRNERTGTSAASVDESFTDKAEYSTEKPVSQITVQGILYSKESAIITMQIKKDGESVFNQSKQLEAVPGIDTTVDLVYSTLK